MPFEIVSFLGILWACFVLGTPGCEVAYYTMSGGFQSAFVQAGFLPEASEAIVLGANLVFWLGAYAMLYWGITCVRNIFSLGPHPLHQGADGLRRHHPLGFPPMEPVLPGNEDGGLAGQFHEADP